MSQISKYNGHEVVIYGSNRTTAACTLILDVGHRIDEKDLEELEALAKRISSSERR